MKKISSKIIISLILAIFMFGGVGFGVGKVSALADCSKLTGVGQTNCQIYNNSGTTGPYYETVNSQTGVITRYQPSGSMIVINPNGSTVVTHADGSVNTETPTVTETSPMWKNAFTAVGKLVAKGADVARGIAALPLYGSIATFLLIVSAVVAGLTFIVSMVFNGVLALSMMTFGDIIAAAGVEQMWLIIRNVINISFIFILLYIAISMILGSFGPSKKSTVAGVVVSALLINYSLFITRIVIDFGNILAVAIYNQDYTGSSFSTTLIAGLQLQNLFSPDVLTLTGQTNALIVMLLQIVLMCVLMGALFKGIIFMLGRIIVLIALLATSPIGFIGLSIPWLKDKADEWWKKLANQVFLLPIFLFFLMMTNLMLQAEATKKILGLFNSSNYSLLDPDKLTGFNVGSWIYYCLIIGMLHMSVEMTKKMSGGVGEIMDKVAKGAKVMAAAGIAIGASVLTGGAAAGPALGMLGRMAAKGGVRERIANAGVNVMARGETLFGKNSVMGDPGISGMVARSIQKNILSSVKEHAGLDIVAANKDLKDSQKEYLKYAGEQANKIGPADIDAEIKRRNETMENINNRATAKMSEGRADKVLLDTVKEANKKTEGLSESITQLSKNVATEKDSTKKSAMEAELTNKKDQLTKLQEEEKKATTVMEARRKQVAKEIGAKMGYNTDEHEELMKKGGKLEQQREERQAARDDYLKNLSEKGYYGKQAADVLRAVKDGKFKEKSAEEILIDQIRKEAKEAAKKEAGETKEPKTK